MTKKEEILTRLAEGKPYSSIVAELNVSKGLVSYYANGSEKNLQRQRDRRNKNRRHIEQVKTDSVCSDCSLNYPYWVLEFDHLGKEEKVMAVSAMVNDYTLDEIKAEIAKCEVVCANCHKHRTYTRASVRQ